jgi:hypothetical protein
MHKRLSIIGVVAVSIMMIAGTATTAAATDEVTDRREISVRTHTVWARGTGQFALDTAGSMRLSLRGSAVIVDGAGDARVHIRPRASDAAANDREEISRAATYTLEGFDGVLWVTGSDFTVEARGKVRRLKTEGEGTLQLAGEGRWFTRHLHGPWGITINYGATTEGV